MTEFFYRAFGLTLVSRLPIQGLMRTEGGNDVDVRIFVNDWPDVEPVVAAKRVFASVAGADGAPLVEVRTIHSGEYWWLRYADGTQFAIDRIGSRIWARWPASLTFEDMATYLLGPVMTFVLRLRGVTCLHASAVAVSGQAIVLAGQTGAGKSTTAAAFARLGYKVLSDDVVPLKVSGEGDVQVEAAYPRIRLWPNSAEALFGGDVELPLLTPNWNKRYLPLGAGHYRFQADALPLGAIYLLDRRRDLSTEMAIHEMSPREALFALVGNSHGGQRLNQAGGGQEFKLLARLASKIPVRRVVYREAISSLNRLCDRIREDAEDAFADANRDFSAEMDCLKRGRLS